jgi:hypothetical protein
MLKRYYQNKEKSFRIQSEEIHAFLEDYRYICKGIREGKKISKAMEERMDSTFKTIACKIRNDAKIKNVMSLIPMYNDMVLVEVYDYELPDPNWNAFCEPKLDEDKELWYFEIEE